MKVYLRILSFVKPYRLMIALSMLSSLLFVLFNAISLWLVSSLIYTIMIPEKVNTNKIVDDQSVYSKLNEFANVLIGQGTQLEQLKILCILLFSCYFFKNIFFYVNNTSLAFVKNRMITDIRSKLFTHVQNLPLSFFHKNKTGEISTIMIRDVAAMRTAFTETIQNLINEPISIFIFIILLFIISPKLTLFTFLAVPLSALFIVKLGQSIRRKARRSSVQIAGLTNILHETLTGIRIVKAFAMEKSEIVRFNRENNKYFKLLFRQDKLKFLTTPTNDLIGVSIGVLLLWIGGREVLINQSMDPEGFIRYILYLFGMMQPARKLGGVNAKIQVGIASADRVFSVLDTSSSLTQVENPVKLSKFQSSIRFENVSFTYETGTFPSLKNVTTSIEKSSTVALVGKSGAGKSTFVDLIPRFYDISEGGLFIDDVNIQHLDIQNLRSKIGFVTQETILFNDSIENNIRYGMPDAEFDKVKEAADKANALEFITELPSGFNTIIGEKGTLLSGGQRQRLSIARAILKDPEILILDEATSSLDTESEQKVQNAIDQLISDRTVIVIAHRLSTIVNADKILVLDQGKLVEEGTHELLLTKNGIYSTLFSSQFN